MSVAGLFTHDLGVANCAGGDSDAILVNVAMLLTRMTRVVNVESGISGI